MNRLHVNEEEKTKPALPAQYAKITLLETKPTLEENNLLYGKKRRRTITAVHMVCRNDALKWFALPEEWGKMLAKTINPINS